MCLNEKDDKGRELKVNIFGQIGGDFRYVELNVIPKKMNLDSK